MTEKWAAALISLVLIFPTASLAATANPYDLDPTNGTFDPRIDLITSPFVDQPTKVWPVVNETKDHDPVVKNTIVIPGGYRFAVDSIKQAGRRVSPSTPATNCEDLFSGPGQTITTAELFTDSVGNNPSGTK